jgi:uncharacterized protein (DUF1697 family)
MRGINVGGKNKLPMAAARALFEDAGCDDVTSYIASGNFVVSASATRAKKLPRIISSAIASAHGLDVPVIVRAGEAVTKIADAGHPFAGEADDKLLHVGFLADKPGPKATRSLDPERSPGDLFAVKGGEIYLAFPNGSARSKLTVAYLDKQLSTVVTLRNWNSVRKLADLVRERG